MSVDMKEMPKWKPDMTQAEKGEALALENLYTNGTTEMHKCGCIIKYYKNKDQAYVRERDWCKLHEFELLGYWIDAGGAKNVLSP